MDSSAMRPSCVVCGRTIARRSLRWASYFRGKPHCTRDARRKLDLSHPADPPVVPQIAYEVGRKIIDRDLCAYCRDGAPCGRQHGRILPALALDEIPEE